MMRKYQVRFGGGPGEKYAPDGAQLACGLPNFIAAGQNLKRLLSARGWGRRPWPDGAAGFAGLRRQPYATPT
jgi:hypothetical protein